jgi:hypothetical protein
MAEIKVILDSVNKREVRFKSEAITTVSTPEGYTSMKDVDHPTATVTLMRAEWEKRGRPNVMHVEDGERCYT